MSHEESLAVANQQDIIRIRPQVQPPEMVTLYTDDLWQGAGLARLLEEVSSTSVTCSLLLEVIIVTATVAPRRGELA